MKNVIFGCTDSKYGDFLIGNWLASLRENVDLSGTDVVVLDYGMTLEQRARLSKEKVKVVKCRRDGHVTILRWRDMVRFLEEHNYAQVLSVDGGDIIFQEDIKPLFEKDRNEVRVVTEDYTIPFEDIFSDNYFTPRNVEKIKETLRGRKMINAGVIFAPRKKFIELGRKLNELITDKSAFGPEQVAVNYILYTSSFVTLDNRYNYVVSSAKRGFHVRDGVFYFAGTEEKIPIVHNAGNHSIFRPIRNFGFGKDHNEVKMFTYYLVRATLMVGYAVSNFIKGSG